MALRFDKKGSAMKKFYKLGLISLILIVLMLVNPFKLVMVVGPSMYPTLKNGNLLLAKKTDHYNRGDIVVARLEDGVVFIKRVVGLPGDHIYFYFDKEKKFLNDNYAVINEFIKLHNNVKLYDIVLRENQYFLVGDNKNNSYDSREFGAVKKEEILYKVIK